MDLSLPLYYVGWTLLYLPPTILWFFKGKLESLEIFAHSRMIGSASLGLWALMVLLLPEAWGAFTLYLLIFNLIYPLYLHMFRNGFEAVSVAVYVCFAVSFLWEWPIQLVIPQNGYALAMSMGKALGIPFYFSILKERGWKVSWLFIIVSWATMSLGWILVGNLLISSVESMFWVLHMYRIPWLILFLIPIIETYLYARGKSGN